MNKIKAKFSMMLGGSDKKFVKALVTTEGTERSLSQAGVTATLKTSQSTAAPLFGGSKDRQSSKPILVKEGETSSNPIGELMAMARKNNKPQS